MGKPYSGQVWRIPDLIKVLKTFMTLIGTYGAEADTPSTPNLSLHLYRLGPGEGDLQRPHRQDEIYFVLSGQRALEVDDGVSPPRRTDLRQGDVVYVGADAKHHFVGEDEITLLVVFAPNFTGPDSQ